MRNINKNYELELYKLIIRPDESDSDICYVQELGWINDKKFCVWIDYLVLDEFMCRLKDIFGYGIFDDGGFDAKMQESYACIDLCAAIGDCVDIEAVFPKDKYKH